MKSVTALVIYMCMTGTAMNIREELNVLVPNNDANRHAKLKEILEESDIDPYESESASDYGRIKNPFVKKIIGQNSFSVSTSSVEQEGSEKNIKQVETFENGTHGNLEKYDTTKSVKTSTMAAGSNNDTENTNTEILTTTEYIASVTEASTANWSDLTPQSTTVNWNSSVTETLRDDKSTTSNENIWWDTTTTKTTSTVLPSTAVEEASCLLGKSSENLKWVNEEGVLQMDFINSVDDLGKQLSLDLSRNFPSGYSNGTENIGILSLAFNNLTSLPEEVIKHSLFKLKYLSLVGNYFNSSISPIDIPNLRELDLRNCNLVNITKDFLDKLHKLEYLYLTNNCIATLEDHSFDLPSLVHLDLSYNKEKVYVGELPNPLKMTLKVFEKLTRLEFLDMSQTKIDVKSINSLNSLSATVIGISLCYTDLVTNGDNFLSKLTSLKFLDVSGNPQLNFTKTVFSSISNSLEILDARDANIDKLDWTMPLTNLRILNLSDNKIRYTDNNSFSHMLYLRSLNLEKNSLSNWYTRLFSQNQELETLNLRENTLTDLTADMVNDLLSVQYLALGKNRFECSCSFHNFMLALFEATKNADISQLINKFNLLDVSEESSRTEFDMISRANEKCLSQIISSMEALRANSYNRNSKSLLSLSESKRMNDSVFHTVLLDYEESNHDYQCMNVTEKQPQSILDLIDLCDDLSLNDNPFLNIDDMVIIALSTSIPLVIIFFLLMALIYWKWWYIRYFCILCKNSAILTFMDDDRDDGKEAIVKRHSTWSLDLFAYDVFVSYSDYNRSWVLDEFLPNIEKRQSINVCLHERDFTVGHGILENIISCMDKSRCLLLLISGKFLESQWCKFEMNLAQHRLLETKKEKLIVVFLEDVPIKNQPKTLRYLIRTKTYIKWPENGSKDEKQLFWRRLKKSIISTKWEHDNFGSSA